MTLTLTASIPDQARPTPDLPFLRTQLDYAIGQLVDAVTAGDEAQAAYWGPRVRHLRVTVAQLAAADQATADQQTVDDRADEWDRILHGPHLTLMPGGAR